MHILVYKIQEENLAFNTIPYMNSFHPYNKFLHIFVSQIFSYDWTQVFFF